MTIYYSPYTKGFYDPATHESFFLSEDHQTTELHTVDGSESPVEVVVAAWKTFWPDPNGPIADAVVISDELHAELLQGQANGKLIAFDGVQPILVAPPAPTKEEYNEFQRQRRETAFIAEYDPLAGKYARGEATQQELIDKATDIRARFPYQD
jgi:hypothetical protein